MIECINPVDIKKEIWFLHFFPEGALKALCATYDGRAPSAIKRRALLNEVFDAPPAARQRDHAARRTWCAGRFGSARVLSPSAASSPLLRTYISAWPELQ